MKTFQKIVDEKTLAVVNENTGADSATQNLILDWFFDYNTCNDNDDTFLKYYQRRLSNLYPLFQDMVRINVAKSNFDPFVIHYMERVGLLNSSDTKTGSKESSGTNKGTGTSTTTSSGSNTNTPNTTSSTTNTGSDSNSSTDSKTSNAKNNNYTSTYPDENLGAISTDIPSSQTVAYLSNGAYAVATGSESNSNNGTTTYDTTNRTVVSGTTNDISSGSSNGSSTNDIATTGNESSTETGSNTSNTKNVEQGRDESIADILPRALNAIRDTSTNELRWLLKEMSPCFCLLDFGEDEED